MQAWLKHLLAMKGSLGLQMDPRATAFQGAVLSKVTVSSTGAQADCHRQGIQNRCWSSVLVTVTLAISALNLSVAGTVRRSGHFPRRGPGDEAGRSSYSENVVHSNYLPTGLQSSSVFTPVSLYQCIPAGWLFYPWNLSTLCVILVLWDSHRQLLVCDIWGIWKYISFFFSLSISYYNTSSV